MKPLASAVVTLSLALLAGACAEPESQDGTVVKLDVPLLSVLGQETQALYAFAKVLKQTEPAETSAVEVASHCQINAKKLYDCARTYLVSINEQLAFVSVKQDVARIESRVTAEKLRAQSSALLPEDLHAREGDESSPSPRPIDTVPAMLKSLVQDQGVESGSDSELAAQVTNLGDTGFFSTGQCKALAIGAPDKAEIRLYDYFAACLFTKYGDDMKVIEGRSVVAVFGASLESGKAFVKRVLPADELGALAPSIR